MNLRSRSCVIAAGVAVAVLAKTQACSVCGCSLSSDWGLQDYSETPGALFSLRYEYFDQDQLRAGTGTVSRHDFPLPHEEELQVSTANRNVMLQLDDAINPEWAVSIQLPYRDRSHQTIAEGDTDVSSSHARGLGDARVLVRYLPKGTLTHRWMLQVGLQVPTGRFDQDFATGPQAGERLDRGLQLGTGTTDLLAGAAWFGRPAVSWGLFTQVLLDQPLAERDAFAPGASLTFNGGVRWLNAGNLTPQLQLNIRTEDRERGVNSDRANSGGTVAFLSPGITAQFSARLGAYVFVQLPVYQRWNGLQLQPRALVITGLNCRW
ncbi:MAG TPA: hypothetical protein VG936_17555 [Lacunisphaera sp.]|nr:hypothetical protein [Lacunisphaera sp.]